MPLSTSGVSINAKSNTGPVPSPRVAMDADFFKVKTACLRKILHSIVSATGDFLEKLFLDGVHDSKRVAQLKKLRTALKDQFARAEESFLDVPLDTVFSSASTCFQKFVSFDKLAKFAKSAETNVDHALSESEKFLKGEFSVEPPARPRNYPGNIQRQHQASIAKAEAAAADAKAIAEAEADAAEAWAIAEAKAEAKAIAEAKTTSSTRRTNGSTPAKPGKCPGRDPASAAVRSGKCPGRDPASAAARSNKCPGRDPASTAARPGKCPGRDPASATARSNKCPG